MNLKIITPEDVHFRRRAEAYIRFNRSGLISLSAQLCYKMELSGLDKASFIFDEDARQYYIGRTLKGSTGFTVTTDKTKQKTNFLKFNAKGLLEQVLSSFNIPGLDVSRPSHTFRVDIHNPVVHFGITLYRMI